MNSSVLIPRAESVSVIVSAFRADPAARRMYPGEAGYDAFFPRFVEAFAGGAFSQDTAFAVDGGAALWLPPGSGPDEDAVGALLAESLPEACQYEVFALLEEMSRVHPTEPHWYLPMIGVEPARQGAGLGSELMREALARVDQDGLPAYLESTNPRNIPFYQRFGFRSLGAIRMPGVPVITSMWRPARRTDSCT
jgi:ribosomal protein S18 acetylase RimI-like enzyme